MRSAAFYAVLMLSVLAPFLGGSVRLWAQATIALGTGFLLFVYPPRRSLGLLPNLAFAIFFLLALLAFLPAHWFSIADWRVELGRLGVQLPRTLSPQPWLTLESVLLLLLKLSWAYYLLASDWNLEERRRAWSWMAAATGLLAGALTVAFLLQKHIPFWGNAPEFGFFPNRNHTSNVFGLGGILAYALALSGFNEGRKNWWIWLVDLSLICWALILNYSRGGIILLGGGILIWHLYWLIASSHKRLPLITSGAIISLLALFAWDGGKTAMRFGRESSDLLSPSENLRFAIHRDAFDLALKSPVIGIGLENFSAVFTTNRHDAIAPSIAGHPESDWLWTAVEMGWFAPLLIASLFCWWATRCFPFEPGTFRLMRMAAFICGCGFILHSFFDVPAHQIGSLWPALLLGSTALHPRRLLPQSRAISFIFRTIAAILMVTAFIWCSSLGNWNRLPTSQRLEQLTASRRAARDSGDYTASVAAASEALRIAPLDWSAYEGRGVAELALHSRFDGARDFAAARFLLPYWPDLWLTQGVLLAAEGETDRAFEVWAEMLRRFPNEAADLYGRIFDAIKLDSELVDRWSTLAGANKKCLLVFFQLAGPTEYQLELDRLLFDDPELKIFDDAQKAAFFSIWYERGDKLSLAEALRQHADWEKIAWQQLAHVYADYQDYRQAYETVQRFAPLPDLPPVSSPEPLDALRARFRLNPTNLSDGLALYFAQMKEGQPDDALRTIRQLAALPRSPRYLSCLEAQLWAKKQEWQKAWQASERFVFKSD